MIQPRQEPVSPSFDIKQTTAEACESCKCESFVDAYLLRKVSALLTKNGKEAFLPIQVFACSQCGHVNPQFIPGEIRTTTSPIVSKLVT